MTIDVIFDFFPKFRLVVLFSGDSNFEQIIPVYFRFEIGKGGEIKGKISPDFHV